MFLGVAYVIHFLSLPCWSLSRGVLQICQFLISMFSIWDSPPPFLIQHKFADYLFSLSFFFIPFFCQNIRLIKFYCILAKMTNVKIGYKFSFAMLLISCLTFMYLIFFFFFLRRKNSNCVYKSLYFVFKQQLVNSNHRSKELTTCTHLSCNKEQEPY